MHDDRALRLYEGMTVEDADGDKIGTVRGIVQPATVAARAADPAAQPAGEVYLTVHTGLPLLGKTLYIPGSAIRDVSGDRVILILDKSRVDTQGWDRPPAGVEA